MPISHDWFQTISELTSPAVPPAWLATRGKGVKVAFIDTGVNTGVSSLQHLNVAGRKFFTGSSGFSAAKLSGQDPVDEALGGGTGHGTPYASLLAGKNPDPSPTNVDLVSGIAEDADYYIIKARNPNDRKTTIRNILNALELCSALKIDVAITGQCIASSELAFEGLKEAELNRVFSLLARSNTAVFAPLKNREASDSWANISRDNFPSLRPEIFNVAKLPDAPGPVLDLIQNQHIQFLLSGFSGKVLSKTGNAFDMHFSNSGAVAIMGAIAILAVSDFKQNNGGSEPDLNTLRALLGQVCKPLQNASNPFQKPSIFKNF